MRENLINEIPGPGYSEQLLNESLGEITVTSRENRFKSGDQIVFKNMLEQTLEGSGIFAQNSSKKMRLEMDIQAYTPADPFQGGKATLQVRYSLYNSGGSREFRKMIISLGVDDTMSTFKDNRLRRAKEKAVINNIYQFRKFLREQYRAFHVRVEKNQYNIIDVMQDSYKHLNLDKSKLGNYYALMISNQDYMEMTEVKTATSDVNAVAATLRDNFGFQIQFLENPSSTQIISAIQEYGKELEPNDNLLVYYAGHSWIDRDADEGYWLAINADLKSTDNWLANDTLIQAVKNLHIRHTLIISDSEFKTKDLIEYPKAKEGDMLTVLNQNASITVLTSGYSKPVEAEGQQKATSIFTRSLLDAFKNVEDTAPALHVWPYMKKTAQGMTNQKPEYLVLKTDQDKGDFILKRQKQ
ncbi:MAG: caspase family protein [Lentisphaeria bacterium]|nr:caspase family protein [Lentisphaeria bacterium]